MAVSSLDESLSLRSRNVENSLWPCLACTYSNSSRAMHCAMCFTRKTISPKCRDVRHTKENSTSNRPSAGKNTRNCHDSSSSRVKVSKDAKSARQSNKKPSDHSAKKLSTTDKTKANSDEENNPPKKVAGPASETEAIGEDARRTSSSKIENMSDRKRKSSKADAANGMDVLENRATKILKLALANSPDTSSGMRRRTKSNSRPPTHLPSPAAAVPSPDTVTQSGGKKKRVSWSIPEKQPGMQRARKMKSLSMSRKRLCIDLSSGSSDDSMNVPESEEVVSDPGTNKEIYATDGGNESVTIAETQPIATSVHRASGLSRRKQRTEKKQSVLPESGKILEDSDVILDTQQMSSDTRKGEPSAVENRQENEKAVEGADSRPEGTAGHRIPKPLLSSSRLSLLSQTPNKPSFLTRHECLTEEDGESDMSANVQLQDSPTRKICKSPLESEQVKMNTPKRDSPRTKHKEGKEAKKGKDGKDEDSGDDFAEVPETPSHPAVNGAGLPVTHQTTPVIRLKTLTDAAPLTPRQKLAVLGQLAAGNYRKCDHLLLLSCIHVSNKN